MSKKLIEVLGGISLFQDLNPNEIIELVRTMSRTSYLAGDVIFKEGDMGNSMYVIESGRVKVTATTPQGKTIELATLASGDLFGELCMIDCGERSATVTVFETTKIYEISRIKFDMLGAELSPIAFKVLRRLSLTVCARLRDVNEKIWELVPQNRSLSEGNKSDPNPGSTRARSKEAPSLWSKLFKR